MKGHAHVLAGEIGALRVSKDNEPMYWLNVPVRLSDDGGKSQSVAYVHEDQITGAYCNTVSSVQEMTTFCYSCRETDTLRKENGIIKTDHVRSLSAPEWSAPEGDW